MQQRIAHKLRPFQGRAKPNRLGQETILNSQAHRCFYCGLKFDDWFNYRGHAKKRTVVWDHLSPYALTFNSETDNFVAACSICNGIKSSKVFDTIKAAVYYVREGLHKRGIQPAATWGNLKTKRLYEGELISAGIVASPDEDEYLTVDEIKSRLSAINLSLKLLKKHEKAKEPASQ